MKKVHLKSVHSKLITIFALMLLIIVISQALFSLFFAEGYYIRTRMREINGVFSALQSNYCDDEETIYNFINKYEEKYNVRIVILNESRNLIYATIPDWKIRMNDIKIPYELFGDLKTFDEDAVATLKTIPTIRGKENKILVLNGEINYQNQKRYVRIESPVSSIQQTVKSTTQLIFILSSIFLIIGILYIYYFSYKLTKPLKEIDEIAENVVKLDFSKKATVGNSQDEISHLAININKMSDKLSAMISELKNANSELEKDVEYKTKLDNIRKEFVANVSHELKTPIALLMGYSEMLKTDMPGIDKDFYYDVIIDESQKMNKLVCQLLDISNLEKKFANLECKEVNLKDMIEWILEKNKIAMENYQLDCSFDGENISALCDEMKIEQAITNYISNAIYHSPNKSKIEISLYSKGEDAYFSVFNEGSSINENDIDKIWNIFYKADQSRTDRESTGLGLYIVSTVINAHKGEYGVINRDNGVEFWFTIKKYKRDEF